jgi:butyrate kinase
MSKTWNIFVINMGSTSSKVAYCQNDTIVKKTEVPHDTKELRALKTPESIVSFYKRVVARFMEENNIDLKKMDAFAIRGVGKMASYRHGAYLLTPQVAADCAAGPLGHIGLFASTMIGNELSQKYNIPAYLYDVVPTNEVPEMACITGIPGYRRRIASHTLNCRATARKVAEQMGRDPHHSSFIVTHLGGGFCTLVYKDGIIIETYSAEEGSFTPERAGRIPSAFLIDLFSNPSYTEEDINRILKKDVGLYGHLGTSNCVEIEKRIREGDKKAKIVYEAMAYQVSKDISSLGAVVCGKVDAVILTGGISHSALFTGMIKERVEYLAPVIVVPGSMEMEALAGGITRVLSGEEPVNDYAEVLRRALCGDSQD